MKNVAVIVKVVNRVFGGEFKTDYQLRKLPPEYMSKNSGEYIEGNIDSVEKALKIAKDLNYKVYENIVDLYWGASETPIKINKP
jgi:hypothetical protein